MVVHTYTSTCVGACDECMLASVPSFQYISMYFVFEVCSATASNFFKLYLVTYRTLLAVRKMTKISCNYINLNKCYCYSCECTLESNSDFYRELVFF